MIWPSIYSLKLFRQSQVRGQSQNRQNQRTPAKRVANQKKLQSILRLQGNRQNGGRIQKRNVQRGEVAVRFSNRGPSG